MTQTMTRVGAIIMDGMNEVEYLTDMNRELTAMGLKPVCSIEESRRPSGRGDAFAMAAEAVGTGHGDTSVRRSDAATDSQINYIISLNFTITGIRDDIEDVYRIGFTKKQASEMIDRLRPVAEEVRAESNRKAQAAANAARAARPAEGKANEVTDGMYLKDDVVYKVQIAKHGSGRLYAKTLTEHGFEYAPGAIRQLRPEHRMTLDQAKEYGKLYGVCCQCGTELTDETSIANGIGPVCARKF
jgi:hypothetical protein